jgi:hypothetical protein
LNYDEENQADHRILTDIHEKWISGRRYMRMNPLEKWDWEQEETESERSEKQTQQSTDEKSHRKLGT